MPVFQVDLQDGRSFEIESDVPPSEQDVLAALGGGVGFDNRTRQPIPSDAAESPMSFLDKVLANPVLGAVTEFAADVPANLVNTPGYLVNKASQAVGGKPIVHQVKRGESLIPEVFPSLEQMAATPIAFPPDALSPFADTTPAAQPMPRTAGLVKGLEDVTRGLVTPETALSLGAVGSPNLGRALATLFGMTSAAHLPQTSAEVGRLSVEGTPAETARAALNTLAQATIAGHVAAGGALGFNQAYQNRPLNPEVLPPAGDRRPVAPTSRQISDAPKQEGYIDLEEIKTAGGTMYKAPGDVQPQIEGPKRQFVGDALGRVIPAEKVNPLGMDVRKPGVGSEPYWTVDPKKSFTEPPPTVGEQPLAVELAGFPAIAGKLNELAERIKRAELVIQPAYQAAGTKDPESQLPTQEITKLSPSSSAAGRPGSAFREPVVQTQQGMYNLPEKTTPAVAPSEGSVGDMALSPYDAASLPAPAKMISGEGQSSTQSGKAPQIEDAKSTTNLGGAEADLPLEQRKTSQKNNSMEAFAKANGVEYVPGDTAKTILERVNKKKQSGSTTESDSGEGYGRRMYGGIFFLDPKFWSENFGKNSHVQMDAKQLYNRIRNKLNEKSKTWQNLDTEELRKFIFGKEKISPKDVADFVTRQEEQQKKMLVESSNADGTPKTDVTARVYPLPEEAQPVTKTPKKLSFEEEGKLISFSDQLNAEIHSRAEAEMKIGAEWFKNLELNVGDELYTPSGNKIKILDGYIRFPTRVTKGSTIRDYTNPMVYAEQLTGHEEQIGTKSSFFVNALQYEPHTPESAKAALEQIRESQKRWHEKKGLGGAMQSAVEKNKEAGSIPNLFYRKNRPIKSSNFQYTLKLKPYVDEVRDATTPRGMGKLLAPVGKAGEKLEATDTVGLKQAGGFLNMVAGTDPRAVASNPVAKAIIANAVQSQKGQNYAALWMESQKDVQRAFEQDNKGQITLENGKKAYMGDVIEAELRNPGSQALTIGQKNFVREWKDLRAKIVSMAQAEGVQSFVDDNGNVIPLNENYFPRPAVGKEGIKQTVKDSVRKQVGGKQFFMKGRYYQTEAEGATAGIKYDPDEYSRIGRWMNAVYKAIADSRMANDPALGGRSVRFGRPKFLEEGMVFQPAFSGRVFDKVTADHLNRYYGETTHAWVKSIANINDFLKAFQFSVDVSAPLNQGLPLMSMRPHRWAKATVKSYAALADDRILNKYIQDPVNQRIAREIVENGGSLVRLQDFLAGAEQGKMAGKIAPIRASARSMGTFLSIAKIEMYKAMEPLMKPGDTKADLVEAVENAVLSGKMEGIGLQQGRALGERLLFNAPSYIRAAFNNIAAAGQGKITGRVARRVLIGMATAISLQMYALYKLSGMSDDEITKRFTPTNSEFLRYPYQMSNGRMKEISYGNILIGMARLAGDSINYLDGTKTLGSGDKNNPWLKWISYRESPVGNLLFELKTGEDYRGEDLSAKQAIAKSMLPVSLSPLAEKGTREGKTIGVLAQGLGLSAYDESAGAFKSRKLNELAQSKYGKKYEELNAAQRRQVTGPAEEMTDALGEKTTPRMILNVEKRQAERKKQLIEDLTPAAQDWLATNKLDVSGWSLKTSVKKKEITLANQAEREKLQELMTQHTQEMLDRMMRTGRKYSQEDVNQRLEMAHKRAWRDMKHLMGNPNSE